MTVDLERQADQAAARGDLAGARRLLEQLVTGDGARFGQWMKLAAMCRAMGDLSGAQAALSGALRIEPTDFMALLMRGNILEQQGHRKEAGEIYGIALFHKPEGVALPPHVQAVAERASRVHADYVDDLAQAIAREMAPARARATPQQQRRLDLFASHSLRRTRPYHQEPTHFHYPGLPELEFHDREDAPWLAELEAMTDVIQSEFEAVVNAEAAELVPYITYPDDLPLRQWAELNQSRKWTAIHLLNRGSLVEANARHCPRTMEALRSVPQPDIPGRSPNAMFSLLAPRTRIPPHSGVANIRLVGHLPLIIPEGCAFRVGNETRPWKRGEAWVFDDTIEHEAWNDSDELRVILLFDVWTTALSAAERQAVRGLMHAMDDASGAEEFGKF